MAKRKFHRDEYPFDILGEFGLTENMIYDLPDFVHEKIEMGAMSPLLPITIEQPFGYTHCYAKFCLTELDDCIGVLFSPKLKEIDLSCFLKQEREMLLAGKVIVSDIEEVATLENGTEWKKKIKAFVQIDKDTNCVMYVPTQIIGRNLQTITNEFEISEEVIKGFWKGELITVDSTEIGSPVTIGIDLFSEKGVVMVPGNASQWHKVVHQKMPEYSFGNDGCWVNNHGLLRYVPEEDFTQDILDALEKQARQIGISVTDASNRDTSNDLLLGKEAEESRQVTR